MRFLLSREPSSVQDIKISAAEAKPITESFNIDEIVNKPFVFEMGK